MNKQAAVMKPFVITIVTIFLVNGIALRAQSPVLYPRLVFAKENIREIKNGDKALALLLKDADKVLNEKIEPVTKKNILAVSGDKHDYVSMGPYWWPDPDKPDGLPYIRRDGERNPEITKLDRYKLDKLIKSVVTLGYAYYFSGEEKYAEKAVKNLRIWFLDEDTRMNPNLNYAQMIPGHNEGKGRGFGIIDVYGMVEMVDCIRLLYSSKAITKTDTEGLKQWFAQFIEWLLTSENGQDEHSAANNHGAAFDVQVAAYALFTDNKELARRFADEFPHKRIFAQIEPDGKQPLELERTIALHYSIFNIVHFMDMAALAQSLGIDLYNAESQDGRNITKAIEFIRAWLGKSQSDFPYKQIKEWEENQNKLCWMLRRASLFMANSEYDSLFEEYHKTPDNDRNWLIFAK